MVKIPKTRSGLIGALDIGSTKICCLIVRPEGGDRVRVLGVANHAARGMKNGTIVDMDAVEEAILNTVHAAESLAGDTLHSICVNISGGYPASRTIPVEVSLSGHEINERDLARVMNLDRLPLNTTERALIHTIPVRYKVDGNRSVRDPRGMYGHSLGADMHIVTAATGAVRTLVTCVERCHLDVEAIIVSPYASGLAVLSDDDKELGVTVIDMGGGTTTLGVFFEGEAVFTDMIPVGGQHVTNDLARALGTPILEAERVKTLYGSALPNGHQSDELLDVPLLGEDGPARATQIPRSMLTNFIQPRIEETFELVRGKLEASGFDRLAGRRVVLTGGASQLPGVRDMAALILDKQVSLGRPIGLENIPDSVAGPAFATCAGLVLHALEERMDVPQRIRLRETNEPQGFLDRLGLWLRENF